MVVRMRSSRNKLNKTYFYDGSKISNAKILEGRYIVCYLSDLLDLKQFLKEFTPWDALVLTIPLEMEGEVSTTRRIQEGQVGKNLIARSSLHKEAIIGFILYLFVINCSIENLILYLFLMQYFTP